MVSNLAHIEKEITFINNRNTRVFKHLKAIMKGFAILLG